MKQIDYRISPVRLFKTAGEVHVELYLGTQDLAAEAVCDNPTRINTNCRQSQQYE